MDIKQILIRNATQKGKKLQALIQYEDGHKKTVPFGAEGYSDYTRHKDPERKARYLNRHQKDPKSIETAGGLARDILWSKPSLSASIKFASKKHGVTIKKA
jgi:hypothetical protein